VAMSGDIRFEGEETYDPSIAVDGVGNIALAWTRTGPNRWPEFWMGAHRPFDPAGVLGTTRLVASSSSIRTAQKADYSGIDPDGVVACRFWGHSPLGLNSSTWQSHVGALCLTGCDASAYADQDESMTVDQLDALVFNSRFQAGDARADCNGDRELDVLDYLCFHDLYEAARR
jgi:hypothetical protein